VVAVRELDHLQNSCIQPMLDRHIHKGRVHTTYNQTRGEEFGTITGRLSSSDPNLQQIHKRDFIMGSLFRSIFVPDKGKIMAAADYEQIEPRLLAHYADVKMLIDGYMSDPPIDAHSMVAINAFGYDPADKSEDNKLKRQQGKTLNQALLTGAGDEKAGMMLGMLPREAQVIINAYFRSMPELKPAQRQIKSVFLAKRYLTSLLGRRSRLEDPRFSYKGMNRLLQCGNADILKKSMADIDEFFLDEGDTVNLLNNIHDDLMYQFSEDDRKLYDRALEMMCDYGPTTQSTYLVVPLTVEAKTGKNWAEASYGKETVADAFKKMGGRYA
jgi:DNA polymerase-1